VVAQIGTPHELYHAPANRFVADFMGTSNLVRAADLAALVAGLQAGPQAGERLFCVRPEDVALVAGGGNGLVRDIHFLGDKSRIQVETPAGLLWSTRLGMCRFERGEAVGVSIQPGDCVALSEG
jgi:ABC-type Fe3+/spermidine/putrescine transport system ATPase subunit